MTNHCSPDTVARDEEFFAKHHMTPDEVVALMMHWQARALKAEAIGVAQTIAWQPIETAPRDGTRLLGTGGGLEDTVEAISYNKRVGAWDTENYTLDDRDDDAEGYNRPSHWMRMPTPLSSTQRGESDRASPAFGYALRLLEHFVAEHFPHNPDWKPCDDLMGVLTQLDNAMTIARDYKEKLRAYEGSPVSSTHRGEK